MLGIPSDGASPTDAPAQPQFSRLMDGYLVTQLLYVTAKLSIADAIAGGPQTAEALAAWGPSRTFYAACCGAWPPRACSTSTLTGASDSPRWGAAASNPLALLNSGRAGHGGTMQRSSPHASTRSVL